MASIEPGRGRVALPERNRSPWFALGMRMLAALGILVFTVLLVYFEHDQYIDGNDPTGEISMIDSIYYTTVTLSTTGYGDIAPVSDRARLTNAFVITPLRIAFLVLLIGTTLEVLASQGRDAFRVARWRKTMGHHVVVVGYGTKGRSAVETLVNNGYDRESVVIVDPSPLALQEAHADGFAVVTGDATRREVLRRAGVAEADQVIITTDRDDSNVLATLTVRQLNPDVYIVAAAREHENAPLMKQSGANSVITSSDAVGRLLGLSSLSPPLGRGDGGPAHPRAGARGGRARAAGLRGRQPAAVAARPGHRGGAGREGAPLLRPHGHPAGARGPADRRPAGQGAALGATAGHAQRAAGLRRGVTALSNNMFDLVPPCWHGRRRVEQAGTRDPARAAHPRRRTGSTPSADGAAALSGAALLGGRRPGRGRGQAPGPARRVAVGASAAGRAGCSTARGCGPTPG